MLRVREEGDKMAMLLVGACREGRVDLVFFFVFRLYNPRIGKYGFRILISPYLLHENIEPA